MDFAVPADHKVKIEESEKSDKFVDLTRELQNTREHEGDCDINCNMCTWDITKGLIKRLEDLEIREQIEIILTTALRSARVQRIVLET